MLGGKRAPGCRVGFFTMFAFTVKQTHTHGSEDTPVLVLPPRFPRHNHTYNLLLHLRFSQRWFCDIMPCSTFKIQLMFRRNISLPTSGSKNRPRKKRVWSGSECYLFHASFILSLFLNLVRRRLYVPPKHLLTFNGLHGVISQKRELFLQSLRWNNEEAWHWHARVYTYLS
jgi:hypothetical protein